MEPEEDLFSTGRKAAASSKLANIFAQEQDYSNQAAALSYKGAKAPPKHGSVPSMSAASSAAASSPSANPGALHACLVSLIKYDAARVGSVVGQRALALMKHQGATLLLVYDPADSSKRDLILPVGEQFAFMPQAPTHGFFYDAEKHYWCVQLPNEAGLQDLAKAIALAKGSNSTGVSVVTQDLFIQASEPRAVSNGDAVKVQFQIRAFTPNAADYGAVLANVGTEDKPKQLKLGAGKEIAGLEQGLVGMKKGGKRIIILPPSLAYGAAGNAALNVPANATLLLVVELKNCKFADKPAQPALMAAEPQPSPAAAAAPATPVAAPAAILLGGSDVAAASSPASAAAAAVPVAGSEPAEPAGEKRRDSLLNRMAALSGGFGMPNIAHAIHPPNVVAASNNPPGGSVTPGAAHHHQQHTGETNDDSPAPMQSPASAQHLAPPPASHPTLSHANSLTQQAGYQPGQQTIDPVQQQQQQQPQQHFQQPPPQQQQQNPGQFNPAYAHQPHLNPHYPSAGAHPGMSTQPGAYGNPYGMHAQPPPPQAALHNPYAPGGIAPSTAGNMYSIESKLDVIQGQLSRCLGTSNQYDPNPALNGAQMLKGLTLLISERDDLKTKSEKAEERITELTAKITALHERNENYLSESQKLSDSRFASFSDELKSKNTTIHELQDSNRTLSHDIATLKASAAEADLKFQKQTLELDFAKGEAKNQKELEKQVAFLTIQLEETKKTHEAAGETVKNSMQSQVIGLQQDLHEKTVEITRLETVAQKNQQEAQEVQTKLQAQLKASQEREADFEKKLSQAESELSLARSSLAEKEGELSSLKLQIDHVRAEKDGSTGELTQEFQRKEEAYQVKLEALQTQVSTAQRQLTEFEENVQQRLLESKREHAAALEKALAEGVEQGKQESFDQFKPKLDEVVQKAKLKIDALSETSANLEKDKADLEAQIASLNEEKEAVIEQSKAVIAKIRVQVQEQQQRHEEALAAAHASAAAASASGSASPSISGGDGIDWREKVKKSMSTLFQTLAASLNASEDESFTRLQIRDLLMQDIKQVTIQMISDENEQPVAAAADDTTDAASSPVAPVEEVATSAAADEPEAVPAAAAPEPEPEPVVAEPEPEPAPVAEPVAAAPAAATSSSKNKKKKNKKKKGGVATTTTIDEETEEESASSSVAATPVVTAATPAEPEPEVESLPEPAVSQKEETPAAAEEPAAVEEPAVEAQPEPEREPEPTPPVEAEPVAEPEPEPQVEAVAEPEPEPEVAESAEDASAPGGAPVVVDDSFDDLPSRARNGATVSPAAAPAPAPAAAPAKMADPFADDGEDVFAKKPAAAASAASSAAPAAKPKHTSLFGDDDDDDALFPAPAPKPKVEAKKSLFDDDD